MGAWRTRQISLSGRTCGQPGASATDHAAEALLAGGVPDLEADLDAVHDELLYEEGGADRGRE